MPEGPSSEERYKRYKETGDQLREAQQKMDRLKIADPITKLRAKLTGEEGEIRGRIARGEEEHAESLHAPSQEDIGRMHDEARSIDSQETERIVEAMEILAEGGTIWVPLKSLKVRFHDRKGNPVNGPAIDAMTVDGWRWEGRLIEYDSQRLEHLSGDPNDKNNVASVYRIADKGREYLRLIKKS